MTSATKIIVQARMTSARLPGKVLKKVLGKPLLTYQIERMQRVKFADELIIATTTNKEDDVIVELCEQLAIPFYRGSENDVLRRYYEAAAHFEAQTIVRLTSDCPLIDPDVVDEIIMEFQSKQKHCDYVSNTIERTFPRGLDTEVFSFPALEQAYLKATQPFEREHVTPYIYLHPEVFRVKQVKSSIDLSKHRWTVDTCADLKLVELMLSELYPWNERFGMEDCLELIRSHPTWFSINQKVEQKLL